MRCVWVEAFSGSKRLRDPDAIMVLQTPHDHSRVGTSAWLQHLNDKRTESADEAAA